MAGEQTDPLCQRSCCQSLGARDRCQGGALVGCDSSGRETARSPWLPGRLLHKARGLHPGVEQGPIWRRAKCSRSLR